MSRRISGDPIMLAHRREDVHDLSDAARVLMLKNGRLGHDALLLGEREFRVGDRVLCRQNDPCLGVRNGTRGTVIDLDTSMSSLVIRADSGGLHRLPAAYSREHLEHGYALTGHAAQGATVERAFVLFRDQGALQEWGYVALSRDRRGTRLYLTGAAFERETDGREPDQPQPSVRLARALERPAAEQLAIGHAPRTIANTSTRSRLLRDDWSPPKRGSATVAGSVAAVAPFSSASRRSSTSSLARSNTSAVSASICDLLDL